MSVHVCSLFSFLLHVYLTHDLTNSPLSLNSLFSTRHVDQWWSVSILSFSSLLPFLNPVLIPPLSSPIAASLILTFTFVYLEDFFLSLYNLRFVKWFSDFLQWNIPWTILFLILGTHNSHLSIFDWKKWAKCVAFPKVYFQKCVNQYLQWWKDECVID